MLEKCGYLILAQAINFLVTSEKMVSRIDALEYCLWLIIVFIFVRVVFEGEASVAGLYLILGGFCSDLGKVC